MIQAYNNKKEIISPQPGLKGICPICDSIVNSKCGSLNIWHFAHINLEDCDSWSEGETEWHLWWKDQVEKEYREVKVGIHRADIKLDNNLVIELQNSPISVDEIREREEFYNNMIWLVNCVDIADNFIFTEKGNYYNFRWKWFKRCWLYAKKPVYLDLGDGDIFKIGTYYGRNGSGRFLDFINHFSLYRKR